jgi:WD40 repeat protein
MNTSTTLTLKKLSVAAGIAFIALGIGEAAQAAQFLKGDIFASIGNGQIQQYRANGTLVDTLNTSRGGFTTGMAFDSTGNLYVTNFSDRSISRFDTTGTLLNAQFVTSSSGNFSPESIVFDKLGNFYVGHADGNADIEKYDKNGNLLNTFNVSTEDRGSDWIDLGADQKTLYYTSEGFQVKRYDVSTATQLSDFSTLGNRPAFALRLLSDGGLLVADSVDIKRLDSTGATIGTYDVLNHNNWFALNLDPNGTSFWSGDFGTGQLHKFDINTGTLQQSINTGSRSLFGVTVFGEITQGGGGGQKVPEPASLLGILTVGVLGGISTVKRKKSS